MMTTRATSGSEITRTICMVASLRCLFRRARSAPEMGGGEIEHCQISEYDLLDSIYRKRIADWVSTLLSGILSSPRGNVLAEEEDEAEQGRAGEEPINRMRRKGRVRSRASAGNCVGRHAIQSRVKYNELEENRSSRKSNLCSRRTSPPPFGWGFSKFLKGNLRVTVP
jgi:hypothetical protein